MPTVAVTDENFEEIYKTLVSNVDRMKRNIEAYGIETLEKKYRDGFTRIKGLILRDADGFARWFTMSRKTFPILDCDWNRFESEMMRCFDKEREENGLVWLYQKALIEEQNLEAYLDCMSRLYEKIKDAVFYPYWMQHCRTKRQRVYNDIWKVWYYPGGEKGNAGWVNKDWSFYTPLFPPVTIYQKATS